MAFDRQLIEAEIALKLIPPEKMVPLAWDALEAGFDGPAIRKLAALERPSGFETDELLPRVMQEIGLATIAKGDAARRLATHWIAEALAGQDDPLRVAGRLEHLYWSAGYPREIQAVGNLDDDAYVMRFMEKKADNEITDWVREKLAEFLQRNSG